jgi:LysM repeat protein
MATKPPGWISGPTKPGDTYKALITGSGFQEPDFGKGAGPGIPYQTRDATVPKPKPAPKPKTPAKPKPKTASKPQSGKYEVQANDTLSAIAKMFGMSTSSLWNYNLNPNIRNASAISTLKSRGPDLIFRGGTFMIPIDKFNAIQRKLR